MDTSLIITIQDDLKTFKQVYDVLLNFVNMDPTKKLYQDLLTKLDLLSILSFSKDASNSILKLVQIDSIQFTKNILKVWDQYDTLFASHHKNLLGTIDQSINEILKMTHKDRQQDRNTKIKSVKELVKTFNEISPNILLLDFDVSDSDATNNVIIEEKQRKIKLTKDILDRGKKGKVDEINNHVSELTGDVSKKYIDLSDAHLLVPDRKLEMIKSAIRKDMNDLRAFLLQNKQYLNKDLVDTIIDSISDSSIFTVQDAFLSNLKTIQKQLNNLGLNPKKKDTSAKNPMTVNNFMYRSIDPVRVAKYEYQLDSFVDTYDDAIIIPLIQQQVTRLNALRAELLKRAKAAEEMRQSAIEEGKSTYASLIGNMDSIRKKHHDIIKSCLRSTKASISVFITKLTDFVRIHHADGITYMNYWLKIVKSNKSDIPFDVIESLKNHETRIDEVCKRVEETMKQIYQIISTAINSSESSASQIALNSEELNDIFQRQMRLKEWMQNETSRVIDAFTKGPPSLLSDLIESPQQLLIYIMKVIRIGVSVVSISLCTSWFQEYFQTQVHDQDGDAPNPARLLIAVMLVDLLIHIVIASVLQLLIYMFKRHDNDFPVDQTFFRLWVWDYFATSIPIIAIGLVLSSVIRYKKYFRYKYDGRRAIRAFSKMLFYIYSVMAPIPFFRIIY